MLVRIGGYSWFPLQLPLLLPPQPQRLDQLAPRLRRRLIPFPGMFLWITEQEVVLQIMVLKMELKQTIQEPQLHAPVREPQLQLPDRVLPAIHLQV